MMNLNDGLELHGMNYHVQPGKVYRGKDLCKVVTDRNGCPKRATNTWRKARVCEWHHGKLTGIL